MTDFSFERAKVDDWEVVAKIEASADKTLYSPRVDKQELLSYIQESAVFFITKDNQRIGIVSWETEKDGSIYIHGLVILPEFRGMGIAKAAMQEILENNKAKRYWLVVHPENVAAIKIYESFGFVAKEKKENYFGDGQPRLVMEKTAMKL